MKYQTARGLISNRRYTIAFRLRTAGPAYRAHARRASGPSSRDVQPASPEGLAARPDWPFGLDFVDAAGPRRDGQPEAWQEWPCIEVAAFSPVGAARGRARTRADAGARALPPP